MDFNNWINQAKEHWREFQPARYRELHEAGTLDQALTVAAEQTHREMSQLEDQGFQNHEAWEMVRERYLFPPEEPGLEEGLENPGASLFQEVMQVHNKLLQDQDE
ncbi:MAG: hypothetical protein GY934_01775 [Gammaproteobacteria bacterium]|nr:hypothetical protein [Gammaproteobacteria bacterium]